MTIDDLVAEAEALAKPCIYLADHENKLPFAAVWREKEISVDHEHWITVDCRFLPEPLSKQGRLSVFIDDRRIGTVLFEPDLTLSRSSSGTNLFATTAQSYPPVDAIFRFGSQRVAEWLETNGWQRDWDYNSNFPDSLVEDYDRFYQSRTPLFFEGPYAQLGGWHMPSPDGDWESLLSDNLVIWTFRDSEPWLEVWESRDGYKVIERIT